MLKNIKQYGIGSLTKYFRIMLPSLAKQYSFNVLFTPKRKQDNWPKLVKQFTIKTRRGRVKAYKYGEGKCIWLIHGWSGSAFDFWPLMQKLGEKGYSTITFDFPAHGYSAGKLSSLPQMIKVFDEIATQLFEPKMVITHGMGASVVANSQWLKNTKSDLLLISPILDAYKYLQTLVSNSGFDQELFDQAIHQLLRQEKMLLSELQAIPKLNDFKPQLKVIHDNHDTLAPFKMSEKLTESSSATLVATNKLGHTKILRSRSLLNTVESYANVASAPSAILHTF